ncbi:MAG: C2H2-type zinc finger protein [Zetaproteobacteria bacterium]|nr:C2H2-type zinc finger protein [Zetaproteobacteria bacterium]
MSPQKRVLFTSLLCLFGALELLADHFPCDQCTKKYASRDHLKRHVRTIHKRKLKAQIRCPLCLATFATKLSMSLHVKAEHKGARKHCPHCPALFKQKSGLNTHIKAQHKKERVPCPECSATFTQASSMRKHWKTQHQGEKKPCPHCAATFSSPSNLSRHLQSMHRASLDDPPNHPAQEEASARENLAANPDSTDTACLEMPIPDLDWTHNELSLVHSLEKKEPEPDQVCHDTLPNDLP